MVLFWAGLLDIMEDPDRFFLYLFDQEIRAGLAVPINIKSVVLERRKLVCFLCFGSNPGVSVLVCGGFHAHLFI